VSNALTDAAPAAAALMATTPLPVHKSATRRPATTPVSCIAAINSCESDWGA
jgi:hypothetical protein